MLFVLIIIALMLDLLLGDPPSWPHPIKIMGKGIEYGEILVRKCFKSPKGLKWGGAILVLSLVLGTYFLVQAMITLAIFIHPYLGFGIQIYLLYASLAVRDLQKHALAVAKPLEIKDLPKARAKVTLIVGRDTENLDEEEITRAVVETVAENTVDGIISPLLYAFIGGAPLAMAYKAVNTLDSMIGYRNKDYNDLGMVAAKFDDLANYLPARFAGFLLLLLAPFTPGGFLRTWHTMRKDSKVHPSPNGGIIEAGVAGALGIQLGGLNYYFGKPSFRGTMGEAKSPLKVHHIYQMLKIMYGLTFLTIFLGIVILFFV